MDWQIIIGICVIIAGIFIAGTALGTRGKILPIILGIATVAFGVYIVLEGETAFVTIIKIAKSIV